VRNVAPLSQHLPSMPAGNDEPYGSTADNLCLVEVDELR
jgi:hypothetical protein